MKVKGKLAGRTSSQPALSPFAKELVEGAGKRPDERGGELLRKKTKVTVSKRSRKATSGEGSEWAPRSKGKEPTIEAAGFPDRPPNVRELCKVDGRVGRDRYFISQISEPSQPDAEGQLKLHWPNLAASSRVLTDIPLSRVVHILIERNLALRVENKGLKSSAGLEAVAAIKSRVTKLSAEVERLKAALGESEQCCKDHKLATKSTRSELKDRQESWRWLEDKVLLLTQVAEVLLGNLSGSVTCREGGE
ncbi:hypothetical protein BHE74_00032194 [Ensete ventricosum]|nr:hypothetical protein BHE74_00032194 [Ensete ventricosum]